MAYTSFELSSESCALPNLMCPSEDDSQRYIMCPSTFQSFGRGGGDLTAALLLALLFSVGMSIYLVLRNRTLRRRLGAFITARPKLDNLDEMQDGAKESSGAKEGNDKDVGSAQRRLSREHCVDGPQHTLGPNQQHQ